MKHNYTIFLSLLFQFNLLFSQNKLLTLEQAVMRWPDIYPETVDKLQWQRDIDEYTYVENNELVQENISGNIAKKVFTLEELNELLKKENIGVLRIFPRYHWIGNATLAFEISQHYLKVDVTRKEVIFHIELDENAKNQEFCEANQKMAYTIDNNLFITGDTGQPRQITYDGKDGIVNGQVVHRNEFGIEKGTFWSPKGNYLAFYRKDETMVKDYPLVNVMKREAEVENIKYPMAGMTSEQVSLGIYDTKSGNTLFLKIEGEKDHYLTNVSWGPDEKYIYVAELNRDQDHMKVNQYDTRTGEWVKTLFEEKSETYVEPLHPLIFLKNTPQQFLWQSRRDGYNHLYLYHTEGDLISQVTKGNWEVTSVVGIDPGEKFIYIIATREGPMERHAYKVELKNGEMTRLTGEAGEHDLLMSYSGKYFIDNYSSINVPQKIDLLSDKGKMVRNIRTAENPLKDYKLGDYNTFSIKAADGITDLYCGMITPPDFDPSEKYPVIVYVYGGPHVQLIHNRWLGGLNPWLYYMAQKGYICFTVDNRGSANRGKAFEDVIYRQLGITEAADQMAGINHIKTLPYVDSTRIGVHGWSYGGFMTINLMLRHNNVVKAGVAGGPVTDWKYYEVMYGERYMDTPEKNPGGYECSSLLNKTDDLEGRLLIIHGDIDPVVVWQHSLVFVKKCVEQGKLLDYFVYPRHEHSVTGMDRVHLMRTITRYFDDHL